MKFLDIMRNIMMKPTQQIVCNYCGLLNTKPYLVKNGLTIVKCESCGLLYTNPQFTAQDLVKLYGQNYFKSNHPLAIGYQDYFKERENVKKEASYYLDVISKFIPLKKTKLLEVGCAFGFFLNMARERGLSVCGVEISDFAAEVARKNFGLTVYTGRFPKVKLPQDFDIVVMWTTLEHVKNPLSYLKKASKLLKSGGLLFVSVPNAGGLLARLTGKKWPGFQKTQEHNYFFTFSTLSNLLEKSGFEIIKKKRAAFFCNLDFIGKKLAAYNRTISKSVIKFCKMTRLSNVCFNFGFIDMLVISKKR